MASAPTEAIEIETTKMTRTQLGAYIRKELQDSNTRAVEVYVKGKKEFARTWLIDFDYSDFNILSL